MIKLLIGGSPCTYWSIAQKNGREVEAKGIGWELFKNYLIAKDKFKPDYFLYENNKSAAQPIKDQISKELGVDLMYINSALVSAQNRQRFYAFNWIVEQPEDRGILLCDILEGGIVDKQKSYCLKHQAGNIRDYFKKHHTQVAYEPVCVNSKSGRGGIAGLQPSLQDRIYSIYGKSTACTTAFMPRIAQPVKVGILPNAKGETKDAQATRIYGIDGKSVNLVANGGGQGAKTGLYAVPVNACNNKAHCVKAQYYKNGLANFVTNGGFPATSVAEPIGFAIAVEWSENGEPTKARSGTDGKIYTVYKVENGIITINGKYYEIDLDDGYYIIRKLTVKECCRLQTLPDDYCRAVSNSQAYKGLGNGWTAEVIIHILNGALKDIPRDEEIVVLSMYDGIGTGRYCLDKMGFTNIKYYAYEIDKYARAIALSNYPDIIQCGDAFQVREDNWTI